MWEFKLSPLPGRRDGEMEAVERWKERKSLMNSSEGTPGFFFPFNTNKQQTAKLLRPVSHCEGGREDEETTTLIILQPIFITVLSVKPPSLPPSFTPSRPPHHAPLLAAGLAGREMTDEDQLH